MKALRSVVSFLFIFFSISPYATAAPTRVVTLVVADKGSDRVTLTWRTPAPAVGTELMLNDIRYSTVPITAINWASRTQVVEPAPVTPGVEQSMTVTGLNPNVKYYFGLKVQDTTWSLLSNVPSDTTLPASRVVPVSWSWDLYPPSAGFLGVEVCQGESAGTYSVCHEKGLNTSHLFTDLSYGKKYYFGVRACYDDNILKEDQPETYESCHLAPNGIWSPWASGSTND